MKYYFKLNEHAVRTRNQGILLRIPKIKLKLGKKAFFFTGSKLYNTLSVDIRSTTNFMSFILTFIIFFKFYCHDLTWLTSN